MLPVSKLYALHAVPGCALMPSMTTHHVPQRVHHDTNCSARRITLATSRCKHVRPMTKKSVEASLTDAQARSVAKRLSKITSRRTKRSVVVPSAAKKKQPLKAWTGRLASKEPTTGIQPDEHSAHTNTLELIEAELQHLGQLPPQSAYVRHRRRLLQSALKIVTNSRCAQIVYVSRTKRCELRCQMLCSCSSVELVETGQAR